MESKLTEDQEFFLVRLCQIAQQMDRRELIRALLSSWEERFHLKRMYQIAARQTGRFIEAEQIYRLAPPETEDEFAEILGYIPTEQEAEEYLRQLEEGVTIGVDIEDIVLGGLEPGEQSPT